VYDADNHYYETADAFLRHLPRQYRNDFEYVEVRGRTKLAVGGKITNYIPNPTFEKVAAPGSHEKWYRGQNPEGLSLRELQGEPIESPAAFRSSAERLKLLDEQGLHASLFFPTLASVVEERMNYDHELMAAVLHSQNLWAEEEWGFAREGRLFAVPMITLADTHLAIQELEWALKAGARCIGIRPAPVPGYRSSRSPGSPDLDPFWARCAEARIFVNLHLSDSGYDAHYRRWSGGEGKENGSFQRNDPLIEMFDPMGRAIGDMVSALICHGVPDRHPDIRFVSVENGSSWVQPMLRTFKKVYGQLPKSFARDPVETFRRNFFVVPFYEDDIRWLADNLGSNRVLFGSDYPHAEGLGQPLDFLHELEGFDAGEIRRIMSDNMQGLLAGVRD
jgi:predicted TIM-barrel fold metal-dependent hydrolase